MSIPEIKPYFYLLALAFILGLTVEFAYSQPYIYSFETYFDEEMGYVSNINRRDLQTGTVKTFGEKFARVVNIHLTPNQEYLFVQKRNYSLEVLKTEGEGFNDFPDVGWLHYVVDAPQVNRIFLGIGNDDETHQLLVMDRLSLEVVDTLDNVGLNFITTYPNDKPFLSMDQRVLYDHVGSQEGILFKKVDTLTLEVITESEQCGEMGSFVMGPGFEDGKNGRAVLRYKSTSGYSDQHYIVCNVESDELGEPLLFPWRSNVQLSQNADYMIIEKVDWTGDQDIPEYRPGIVYIFETSTNKLTQRLQLPPEGKLLLFEHYPDKLFYHVDEEQAIPIDVHHVLSDTELLNDLLGLLDEAFQNGWITNQGIYRSLQATLENVNRQLGRGNNHTAVNNLQAFLNEVEAQNDRHLTSEAYTLLRFNAEYLLTNLSEED